MKRNRKAISVFVGGPHDGLQIEEPSRRKAGERIVCLDISGNMQAASIYRRCRKRPWKLLYERRLTIEEVRQARARREAQLRLRASPN